MRSSWSGGSMVVATLPIPTSRVRGLVTFGLPKRHRTDLGFGGFVATG
jgi:hypothetical protein